MAVSDNNAGHLAQALAELLDLQEVGEAYLNAFEVHTLALLKMLNSIRDDGAIDDDNWIRLTPLVDELRGVVERYVTWTEGG